MKIHTIQAGLMLATLALSASACSIQASGELGKLQAQAKACPRGIVDSYVGDDVSGTSRARSITSTRHSVIKDVVSRTAVCGGHLRVDAFTGSSAASVIVFDGDLKPPGATLIARLRQVSKLTDSATRTIDEGIATATASLPANGSDILGQFDLLSDYSRQRRMVSDGHTLEADLLTDGVQTTSVVLNTSALTSSVAIDLAKNAPIVTLPVNSRIKVSGLGKVDGSQPPTSYVAALKAFYLTYCHRTGAATCDAVVDYTAGS